ncbi:phosphotransferase [Candidatus Saccharibacteria bacterium]|nr:phosphotransferase [Candidatus Saccharibacteria bacterium]
MVESPFTADDLLTLEADLIAALASQGFDVESIKLIGLKGSGSNSTVFSVLINDVYHVLKVYREAGAYKREIHNLRAQISLDRMFFVWPAELHRYRYNIVVIEVPEGQEMHSSDLGPAAAKQFASCMLGLHSIRYREKGSTRALEVRLRGQMGAILAHAADYESIDGDEIEAVIERAIRYLRRHAKSFRTSRSRVHGDPWWGNVIVANEGFYLVDWEGVKRDDYCEDLAKFRVLVDYERDSEPASFWDTEPNYDAVDHFMDDVLARYEDHFDAETNIRGRYGFYCLYFACIVFGDYYYDVKHGSVEAKNILRSGIDLFLRYSIKGA